MKNCIPIIMGTVLFILWFVSSVFAQQKAVSIIPEPASVVHRDGEFELNSETKLFVNFANPDLHRIATNFASDYERASTWKLLVTDSKTVEATEQNYIWIFLEPGSESAKFDPTTHPAVNRTSTIESYSLDITSSGIKLTATHPAGIFYGIQSLRQLLPPAFEAPSYSLVPNGTRWSVPALSIIDNPRFPYRGMHLDVSRHFMPVSFVKKYLDLLALHKMNTFHWHLTDDQGWRIQIDAYPLLTKIGAYRDSTLIGNYGSSRYDGMRYGGYYSKDEITEIVKYARERFITIIPEIELPGHASAALAAYPQFGCTDLDIEYKVQSTWGIFPEIFCPKEETFEFLTTVLDEVMELFPGPFIHIGGDEAMKNHWKISSIAQEVIRREGLSNEDELQSYFIRRMDDHLSKAGRRLLGWDEILEGGLAPNATVMSWRGEDGGIYAARMGHDAVMSPTGYAYFDYYQSTDRDNEPISIGGFLPLDKVYNYEPIPAKLEADRHHHILGAQGNVWTEYMKTTDKVEYMAFPRLSAMSEVGWSVKENRNYESFIYRLSYHLKRLDWMDVNYRNPF